MSQYSKTVKQQLEAYNRTFSTTLNTNYKNAFIQCRKSKINCNVMKSQLNNVNDTLRKIKNLEISVKSNVESGKNKISNYENKLSKQTKEYKAKLYDLNSTNDYQQASGILRQNKESSLTYDYFTLAYYFLTIVLIIYLLHIQYKFSALYFLAVFLVILLVISVLAWWGIPY